MVRRGVHPVRFNVISRVPSLPPSLVLLSFHSSPTPSLPQSVFLLVHPQPRRHHSPPHLTTRPPGIFNLRKPSSERTKERRKEGGGREMDEEAGRRREEGGWSRGWKSIPLGGVTSRAQLARARVSFRRGFRILAAVDWRFLRFRFSPPPRWRQPVMHTVREPDLRPPSPASPGLLPTAHRSSPLSLSLSVPLPPPVAFLPFSPSAEQLEPVRGGRLLPRGERESVLSNFLADISRYNNWAFSASLPFFSLSLPRPTQLGLLRSPFTRGGGSLNYIPRAGVRG